MEYTYLRDLMIAARREPGIELVEKEKEKEKEKSE